MFILNSKLKRVITLPLAVMSITLLAVPFCLPSSFASLTGKFKPAKDSAPSDQRRTVSSGSRSVCEHSVKAGNLELLVPEQKVVHKTTRKNPVLYFYYHSKRPIKLEFILTSLDKLKPVYRTTVLIQNAGLKSIALPKEAQLDVGSYYVWNIVIPCLNNHNLRQTVLNAGIEFSPNTSIIEQIKSTKSIEEQIQIYANNGIWYEALDLSIKNRDILGYENYFQAFSALLNEEPANIKNVQRN